MRWNRSLALALTFALVCHASEDENSRMALLSRVLERMQVVLRRMPNYTCTETITRTIGDGTPLHVDTLERLRLQVAIIGGKEVFSWPGAAPFERIDPHDIVGGGLTGTGDFEGFSHAVLGSDIPEFTTGEEELDGGVQRAIRYEYRVPLKNSGYRLHAGIDSAIVDYGGAFWVEPASEHVLALEVIADIRRNNIPETLDISSAKTRLEYQYIRSGAGAEEFPFPAASTLTVSHLRASTVTSNRIQFSGCREYKSDSSIHFSDASSSVLSETPTLAKQAPLPGALTLDLALDAPIRVASSAAGDAITATLLRPVKVGSMVIPKGAKVSGRVLLFETDLEKNTTHLRLGFSHLESGGKLFPFRARFVTFRSAPGVAPEGPRHEKWVNLRDIRNASASEWKSQANFTLIGNQAQMVAGFRMEWMTMGEPDN